MTTNVPHSFFSLKTQFENLGDALINLELIKLTAEQGPVFVDLSRCPAEFRDTLALDTLENVSTFNSTKTLLKALFQARREGKRVYWFLSPGGYFGEISGKEILQRLPNLGVLAIMRLIGVQICHVGVSYERLGPSHRKFLKLRKPLLAHHVVRDQRSFEYIRAQGIEADDVFPDLALNLFSTPLQERAPKNQIAFCFRGDQHENQEQEIKTFLNWLLERVSKDVTFRMVVQVARDEEVMRRLAKILEEDHGRDVTVSICYDDLETCKAAYAECDMVIANRLHGILVGGSQNGHILACVRGEENEKIRGLFGSLNIADQIIELDKDLGTGAETALKKAQSTQFSGATARAELLKGMKRIMKAPGDNA